MLPPITNMAAVYILFDFVISFEQEMKQLVGRQLREELEKYDFDELVTLCNACLASGEYNDIMRLGT